MTEPTIAPVAKRSSTLAEPDAWSVANSIASSNVAVRTSDRRHMRGFRALQV